MSAPTRYLLDKVAARRILEAIFRLGERRSLDAERNSALSFFELTRVRNAPLFIVPKTAQLLHDLKQIPRYSSGISYFFHYVEVVKPGRYNTRWARRLRDYGFTREDASILSLATFGTTNNGAVIGIHTVVTYDQPMINNWHMQQKAIRTRLEAMCQNLPEPYSQANLPKLLRP